MLQGKVTRHGQEHHVAFTGRLDVKEFHRHILATNARYHLAGTAFRTKNAETTDGELTLDQTLLDFLADGARGAHNADRQSVTLRCHFQTSAGTVGQATGKTEGGCR